MPVLKDAPPILDSSGRPANGYLRVMVTNAYDAGTGHVTAAVGLVEVKDGICRIDGEPWAPPPTPEGVQLVILQDLDNETVKQIRTVVPDQAEITYSELLFNRGGNGGGQTYAFVWHLAVGAPDFPAVAISGDLGIDDDSNLWRYKP